MINSYKNAEKLLETKSLVLNAYPKINWIDNTTFWYNKEKYNGDEICNEKIKVDCACKEVSLFEDKTNEKEDDDKDKNNIEVISPDKNYSICFDGYNLSLKNLKNGESKNITNDGCKYFDYGSVTGCSNRAVRSAIEKTEVEPSVIWSDDSKRILTYKLDQRDVKEMHVVQNVIEDEEDHRPRLYSYKYHLPNDEYIPLAYLCIYDIEKDELEMLDVEPLIINFGRPFENATKKVKWSADSKNIYYVRMNRYFNEAKFNIYNIDDKKCNTVVYEKTDKFLFLDSYGSADGGIDFNFSCYLSSDNKYAIWYSEREGNARLYKYDVITGKLLNNITGGEYIVKNLVGVDEKNEVIYFNANGFKDSSDPYFTYFCKINLDGTGFKRLVDEDADHTVSLSPNYQYFVDTYSRVDLSPITVLRNNLGELILEIEKADISRLLEAGFVTPERFSIKASDGITELYGIIIKPSNFDKNKKYPVIDYIYGGVQCINVPKKFVWHMEGKEACGGLESFAQLGFIGIILDGPGTPNRSKDFHNICYRNLQGSAGLKEHEYCTKKLAEIYDFIDIDRVGIWGSSGGGYGTLRALCEYPQVYKVGVAIAGNHDERMYNACWVERYNGEYIKDTYDKQDNSKLVSNLSGKLLLIHGDLDDNVHMSNTMRVVNELINNNKDFDMLIVPNQYHDVSKNNYVIRKKWDYFVKHLLCEDAPKEYAIENK